MTTPNKEYKHIAYGAGFRIECRYKTWKERTLQQKLLFWRKYKTALFPITSEDLHKLPPLCASAAVTVKEAIDE